MKNQEGLESPETNLRIALMNFTFVILLAEKRETIVTALKITGAILALVVIPPDDVTTSRSQALIHKFYNVL